MLNRLIAAVFRYTGPKGMFARTQSTGASAAVIVTLLLIFLVALLA